jgi:tRNA(Ile)-lysidine synthase TilS/MesJ
MQYFQKKFFYTIRKFNLIKPKDKISYESAKDFRDAVLEDLFKTFSGKLMIEFAKYSKKKTGKMAVASTIDLESDKIIHTIINDKISRIKKSAPIEKKNNQLIIKPLYLFLDKEVMLYAQLRRLKFKKEENKKDKISEFVEEMEKKHPEIKRAVVNSYLELYP